MDINNIYSVNNNNEINVKENKLNNIDCPSQLFEAYFYILFEYINKNRKSEIKLNDLINSDNCILISGSVEPYLTKRFHAYCDKLTIDYQSNNHIIPTKLSYSISSVITVIHNYRHLNKISPKILLSKKDEFIHYRPQSAAVINPSPTLSCEDMICLNSRHYLSSVTSIESVSSTINLPALLMEKNFTLRPPTITPDRNHLNDLSTVDCEDLKAAEKASNNWNSKLTTTTSDYSYNEGNRVLIEEWGTVMYYELNSRVGDAFVSATPIVTIDGYTYPSAKSSRFSLGHLTNVSRSSKIEETRKFIGRGAKFYYIHGELFIECLSDNAIFVQSPLSNIMAGWHPATVIKIPPKCNIKVFNEKDFITVVDQHESGGFEAVFSLTPLCSIRISFVKGWGASYSRQTITTTPCWVEVHLNQPLKCLDAALRHLETPSNQCSSRS